MDGLATWFLDCILFCLVTRFSGRRLTGEGGSRMRG